RRSDRRRARLPARARGDRDRRAARRADRAAALAARGARSLRARSAGAGDRRAPAGIGFGGAAVDGDDARAKTRGDAEMTAHPRPEIHLIVNLALVDPDGRVLLVAGADEGERWSLPGWELEPYEHPEEGARQLLVDFLGLPEAPATLVYVDSFRGRRGWHVTFNY